MKKLSSLFHKDHPAPKGIPSRPHFWHMIGGDPFVDWVLILCLCCLVAFSGLIFGAYVYVNSKAELSSMPPINSPASPAARFDMHELGAITAAFDERAGERVLLDKAYAGPSDPSLP